jgi:sugar lactone lactonase YvrE
MQAVNDVTRDLRITASGIDHPEGVAWYDGYVWCGTESGSLIRIDPDNGHKEVVAETGGFLLGLAFDGDGACYICDSNGRIVRVDRDGSADTFVDTVAGKALRTPNYAAFTSDGTLWFSDSGSGWEADDGCLVKVPPGGEPEIVTDETRLFPNGIAISADESLLYLVESRRPGIVTVELSGATVGGVVEALPTPGAVPDGLAFDREGSLYISCWRPDRVYRWTSRSRVEVLLDDPTAEYLNSPTNLCFGGSDLTRIYFASLGGWAITELDGDISGQPLQHPRL